MCDLIVNVKVIVKVERDNVFSCRRQGFFFLRACKNTVYVECGIDLA